jgi:hypothetical protein
MQQEAGIRDTELTDVASLKLGTSRGEGEEFVNYLDIFHPEF